MKMGKYIAVVIVFIVIFAGVQRLLTPKYMSSVYEGAMTGEYYESPHNNEVLILGDCEAYENFSPITLFEEFGITSYIRGGPQQLVWQAYYVLADTLRYETPKVVILNIRQMHNGENESEAYNRLNLDTMRMSVFKLMAVATSLNENESAISYVFPLLRWHDRWQSLSSDDVRYYLSQDKTSFNGYYMRCDAKPADMFPTGQRLPSYDFSVKAWEYLDKIRGLCNNYGIALVLVKPPTIWPYWYDEWDSQISAYAEKYGLPYYNMLANSEKVGIDWQTDTYDGGLHMNVYGAEKCSRWLGACLQDAADLSDFRSDASISVYWAQLTADYEHMKAVQTNEIDTYGKIQTFTY